jgi:hypothetical protein
MTGRKFSPSSHKIRAITPPRNVMSPAISLSEPEPCAPISNAGERCALVDKSLVVPDNADDRTRYRLLETVRQYALEKLGESNEADEVRTRHRDHYTALAARLHAPARDDYEHLLAQAEIDIDNLRAAFTWSRETEDIAKAAELASSLMPVWLARGHISEGLAWLDAAGAESEGGDPATLARAIADKAVLSSWVDIRCGSGFSTHWRSRARSMSRRC